MRSGAQGSGFLQGRDDLARGARQLALHVALCIAPGPDAERGPVDHLLAELVEVLGTLELHPPVRELLEKYAR